MSEVRGQQEPAAAAPASSDLLGAAKRAMTAGRLAEAEAMLRRLLSPYAEGAVWKGLADIFARQRRFDLARNHYQEALARGAPAAEIHNNLGNLCEAQGDLKTAESHYRRALVLKPTLGEASSNLGVVLARRGEFEGAADQFRQALEVNPGFTNARRNLANALFSLAKREEAFEVLTAGLDLAPGDIDLRVQLADFQHAAGRAEEAAVSYREAIGRNPGHAAAQMGLGRCLLDAGESEGAIRHCRQAVEIEPGNPGAHILLGRALFRHGAVGDATIHFRRAIELDPSAVEARLHLGNTLEWRGDLAAAAREHQKAIELNPAYVEAYNNLGNVRLKQSRVSEASEAFRKAIELDPGNAAAHSNLGVALQESEEYEKALASLHKALELDPRLAEAHGNLGAISLIRGDVEEAKAHYSRSLALKPDAAFALYGLSQLDMLTPPEQMIELIQSLLEDPRISREDKSRLYFTLARYFDTAGNSEEAFRAAEAGNAIERRRRSFEAAAHARFADRIIATFDEAFFERRPYHGSTSETPIFIVGMPHSGSTLVEQILASHPRVFGGGELSYIADLTAQLPSLTRSRAPFPEAVAELDEPHVLRLAGHYLRQLRLLGGRIDRVTDKMLFNGFRLGFISLLFPKGKIIYCRRDPLDIFISGYLLRFSKNLAYTCDQNDFAQYYAIYRRLMDHWSRVLPSRLLTIDYEDMVAKQTEVSRRLVEFCGLEWDERCLEFHRSDRPVRTGSSLQVRRPIYPTSVGRWRDYERFLGPVKAALLAQNAPAVAPAEAKPAASD